MTPRNKAVSIVPIIPTTSTIPTLAGKQKSSIFPALSVETKGSTCQRYGAAVDLDGLVARSKLSVGRYTRQQERHARPLDSRLFCSAVLGAERSAARPPPDKQASRPCPWRGGVLARGLGIQPGVPTRLVSHTHGEPRAPHPRIHPMRPFYHWTPSLASAAEYGLCPPSPSETAGRACRQMPP